MRKPRWNTSEPIELDGRTLEGGGQLVRNAVCLSALTGIPIKIHHVRGARAGGGGLKHQHLACVNWLAHACRARVEGAELRSTTLVFEPGKGAEALPCGHSPAFKKVMRNGDPVYECRLDIGTAGATGLALQAILPYILFSEFPSRIPVRLTLTGGTNVSGSPSYEYITQVLLPTLHAIGFPRIEPKLQKRGWSQGGGSSIGEIAFTIPPRDGMDIAAFQLGSVSLQRKLRQPLHLQATFIAPSSCHEHFRTLILPTIQHYFGDTFSQPTGKLEVKCEGSLHEKHMYLILVATMSAEATDPRASSSSSASKTYKLGSDCLYGSKIRSHERATTEMVDRVTQNLAAEVSSGAYVDACMRDQLVIFQALANGKSQVYPGVDGDGQLREPSLHARTAEWIMKQLLGVKFDAWSACEGVGFGTSEEDNALLVDGHFSTTAVGEEGLEERMERLSIGQS